MPTDVNFDRVLSMQLGNNADPIDKPEMFTWLTQTPSPGNGYAVLKCIANDPVGNVRETFFDSRNLPVDQLDYTGRATPGVVVTETANRPTGQLRASDPQFFETRAQWNLNFLPTGVTLPRGNARALVWETDFNPTATARESGNLRTFRQIGLASETLVWRMQHEPGFGTSEQCFVSRLMEEEGMFYNLEGDPDQPIIIGSVYNASREIGFVADPEGTNWTSIGSVDPLFRLFGDTTADRMWSGFVQRISQGRRARHPLFRPIRLLETRSRVSKIDLPKFTAKLATEHVGDGSQRRKEGLYFPEAMLTEINQPALQSNRLYIGGLSWVPPAKAHATTRCGFMKLAESPTAKAQAGSILTCIRTSGSTRPNCRIRSIPISRGGRLANLTWTDATSSFGDAISRAP